MARLRTGAADITRLGTERPRAVVFPSSHDDIGPPRIDPPLHVGPSSSVLPFSLATDGCGGVDSGEGVHPPPAILLTVKKELRPPSA